MNNLIGQDVMLMRNRYDEALRLRGVPATYQYPIFASSNVHGEPVTDYYSDAEETYIFFEGSPKLKTYKRLGWVVENDKELPFLVHCSYHLKDLQKDCLFAFSGQHTGMPERVFRVVELTTDIQAPDHVICQVVPVYDKQAVGRTEKEVEQIYNSSNHFLKENVDYRGRYRSELPGE